MKYLLLSTLFIVFVSCKESQYAMHVDNKFEDKPKAAFIAPHVTQGNDGLVRDLSKPGYYATDRFHECTDYKTGLGKEIILSTQMLGKIYPLLSNYKIHNDGRDTRAKIEFLKNKIIKELNDDIIADLLAQDINVFNAHPDIVEQYATAIITLKNDWARVHFVNIKMDNNYFLVFRAEGRNWTEEHKDPSRCIDFASTMPENVSYKLVCQNKKDSLSLVEKANGLFELKVNDEVMATDIGMDEIRQSTMKDYSLAYSAPEGDNASFEIAINRVGVLKKAEIQSLENEKPAKLSGLKCYKFE